MKNRPTKSISSVFGLFGGLFFLQSGAILALIFLLINIQLEMLFPTFTINYVFGIEMYLIFEVIVTFLSFFIALGLIKIDFIQKNKFLTVYRICCYLLIPFGPVIAHYLRSLLKSSSDESQSKDTTINLFGYSIGCLSIFTLVIGAILTIAPLVLKEGIISLLYPFMTMSSRYYMVGIGIIYMVMALFDWILLAGFKLKKLNLAEVLTKPTKFRTFLDVWFMINLIGFPAGTFIGVYYIAMKKKIVQ